MRTTCDKQFVALLVALGVGVVVYTLVEYGNYEAALPCVATVLEASTYTDDEGDTRYQILVEYEVEGERYEATVKNVGRHLQEGMSVDIRYDPARPHKVRRKPPDGNILFALFVFVVAGRQWNRKSVDSDADGS